VALVVDVDRDNDALSPGHHDEVFDALLVAAEPVFGAVFNDQREAFEVAEAVVGCANDLLGESAGMIVVMIVARFGKVVRRLDRAPDTSG
jgi:hypothetical protein